VESVSIVVPTYGRPQRLAECIGALARLDYDPARFEVIVVEDGSDRFADSEAAVRSRGEGISVRLLRKMHGGPAAARNHGAAQSKYDLLAFTDDDCRPDPGWLSALVAPLTVSPNRVVGGSTVNALESNPYSAASQVLVSYLSEYYRRIGEPFLASNNLALSRDQYRRIGGFDESYALAAGEDRDFCLRCHRSGCELIQLPDAVVRHYHALSAAGFLRQHFNYGRGARRFHGDRDGRARGRLSPEPLRFYADLVAYPLSRPELRRRYRIATLLLLAQVANAAGFLFAARPAD
jgi:GT2 family glycosyltransferase